MRLDRSTGAVSGLLIVLLGIWGALVPFVGPYFDYSFGTNSTWHYTTDRLWLDILPGVTAVVGGLLIFFAATRVAGAVGGWLAVLAGAWFAVGPAVSLTWEGAIGPIGPPLYGSTRQALELIGYFYGLGALIVALGAFAVGRFGPRPRLGKEAAPAVETRKSRVSEAPRRKAPGEGAPRSPAREGRPAGVAGGEATAPSRTPAGEGPPRRRLPLRRRTRESINR